MSLLVIAALTLPANPSGAKPVADWQTDPACRLVFFAVLQGLYEDGVSDEVVNNIVPPDKQGREQMRHSFVLDCPLCLPAYEAFRAYQGRPRNGPVLGQGLPAKTVEGLLSKTLSVRLMTLRGPIKRWVEARLITMKLTDEERQQWWTDITARVGQGRSTLEGLKKADPWYQGWSGYWGCAACLGAEDACRGLPGATPRK
jgi:hypothetical protein